MIYFKYDFGYEFGIVLPGEQKPGAPRKIVTGPSKKEEGAVDFPIIHETSQKKKPSKGKSVKWEPTSESEMSEIESGRVKKRVFPPRPSTQTPSPRSLSPSDSPYTSFGRDHTGSRCFTQLASRTLELFFAFIYVLLYIQLMFSSR